MKICEIFASVQGESSYAGLPCVFVRLTGCNLRCRFCDTTYAYEEGVEMGLEEILAEVAGHRINLVEVTGGEPLLQAGTVILIRRLLDEGFKVLLETNGSMSLRDVDKRTVVIMDIKTPKSGEYEKMDLSNIDLLKPADEVKFVVADREDYEWTKEFISAHGLFEKCRVLLSPAFGSLQPRTLASWMLEDRFPARLNLQLHKYIYSPNERGV